MKRFLTAMIAFALLVETSADNGGNQKTTAKPASKSTPSPEPAKTDGGGDKPTPAKTPEPVSKSTPSPKPAKTPKPVSKSTPPTKPKKAVKGSPASGGNVIPKPKSKELSELRWIPMRSAYLGCLKGCLDHLGIDVSEAWLSGGTGQAFVINVHENVLPRGPTDWDFKASHKLGNNLGFNLETIAFPAKSKNIAKRQERLWEKLRQRLDAGLPCIGWGLEQPDYYVIRGYDEEGYLFSGPHREKGGRIKWNEIGEGDTGNVEMIVVKKGKPAPPRQTVADALAFAVQHAKTPNEWTFPKCKSGPAAYDLWIAALNNRSADPVGVAVNAAIWEECRRNAVAFLKEAEKRLHDKELSPLFEKVIKNYQVAAESLARVAELFPLKNTSLKQKRSNVNDKNRRYKAIAYLKVAKKAENTALANLKNMVAALREPDKKQATKKKSNPPKTPAKPPEKSPAKK